MHLYSGHNLSFINMIFFTYSVSYWWHYWPGELCILQQRLCRQKHNDIMTRNQTAIVYAPKPPPYTSLLNLKKKQQQLRRREHQAQVKTT